MMEITLYKKDSGGSIRVFHIVETTSGYETRAGVLGGVLQVTEHPVPAGLAKRTRQEQIHFKMRSVSNKKRDSGYTHDLEFAKNNETTNDSGLLLPMKALRIEDHVDLIDWSRTFVQRKFNGYRCVYDPKVGIAYSKKGKEFTAITEILEDLKFVFEKTELRYPLDGELYCHGMSLQQISSAAKKRSDATKRLQFVVFDAMMPEFFTQRLRYLESLDIGYHNDTVCLAQTTMCAGKFNYEKIRDSFIADGYEGAMLRQDKYVYEYGRRSRSIFKIKRMKDKEFKVIDILASVDGWARLVCEVVPGKTFNCSAPGSVEDKKAVLENKNNYLGKFVTVEFADYSDDGIPTQPVAITWIDEEDV